MSRILRVRHNLAGTAFLPTWFILPRIVAIVALVAFAGDFAFS
jgi:hypothetical protein